MLALFLTGALTWSTGIHLFIRLFSNQKNVAELINVVSNFTLKRNIFNIGYRNRMLNLWKVVTMLTALENKKLMKLMRY